MFKFMFGLTSGVIIGACGLVVTQIIMLIALEDSPEARAILKEKWNQS